MSHIKNIDWSQYSNDELVQAHRDLKAKVRSEQTRYLNKKDTFGSKISKQRFSGNKELSNIDTKALFAGNVGDIDKILWPFLFQSVTSEVAAGANVTQNITITQEAAFSLVSIQKTVFKKVGADWVYLNPRAVDAAGIESGLANGLKFSIEESQTGVNWFDTPIDVDHIGDGRNPYTMDSPTLMLPNTNTQIKFHNTSAETYMVNLLMIGYRVRIEDAVNLMSLVTE